MSLALGFDGIIFNDAQTPSDSILPFAFDGIIIAYSYNTIFITVTNGLGKPIEGLTVKSTFAGDPVENVTDAQGLVTMEVDDTATLNFIKEKTFRSKHYDRVVEGDFIDYVYNIPILE